jgi:AAA domain
MRSRRAGRPRNLNPSRATWDGTPPAVAACPARSHKRLFDNGRRLAGFAHTGPVRLTSLHAEDVLSFGSFTVSFEPGLNTIVGPNGAGKSNVVRAVGLVRTALDIAVGAARASIDVPHQLRMCAPERRGVVWLGVNSPRTTSVHCSWPLSGLWSRLRATRDIQERSVVVVTSAW